MTPRTCKLMYCTGAIALAMVSLAGCSGSHRSNPSQDASPDAVADCVQLQQAYVQAKLATSPPSDVAGAVHTVLSGSDFPQAMPYCSGPRPSVH